MRRDFAELVFPVLYDGGRGTLWYAFFFNSMISGYGALCLPDCHVKNLRSRARSVNYGGQVALKSNAIWIESRPILPFAVRLAQRLLGHKRVGIARIFNSLYARFPRLMIRPEADAIARVKRFRQAVADSQ
jgi:hypothetical protein